MDSFANVARKLNDLGHSSGCISRCRGKECGVDVSTGAVRAVTQKGKSEGKPRADEGTATAYMAAHGGCSCGGNGTSTGKCKTTKHNPPPVDLDTLRAYTTALASGTLPEVVASMLRSQIELATKTVKAQIESLSARRDHLFSEIDEVEMEISTLRAAIPSDATVAE